LSTKTLSLGIFDPPNVKKPEGELTPPENCYYAETIDASVEFIGV
jgi:hypothetical protein